MHLQDVTIHLQLSAEESHVPLATRTAGENARGQRVRFSPFAVPGHFESTTLQFDL